MSDGSNGEWKGFSSMSDKPGTTTDGGIILRGPADAATASPPTPADVVTTRLAVACVTGIGLACVIFIGLSPIMGHEPHESQESLKLVMATAVGSLAGFLSQGMKRA